MCKYDLNPSQLATLEAGHLAMTSIMVGLRICDTLGEESITTPEFAEFLITVIEGYAEACMAASMLEGGPNYPGDAPC